MKIKYFSKKGISGKSLKWPVKILILSLLIFSVALIGSEIVSGETPPSEKELGEVAIRNLKEAKDLTSNSKIRKELDNIIAKIEAALEAIQAENKDKAMEKKLDALKEIDVLLSTAKGKGESDSFIEKLQKAKANIKEMIKMEEEAPSEPPSEEEEVGVGVIDNLEQAKDFTQYSQTRKELDKITGKIEEALKAIKAKDEKKAMEWKLDALKEIDELLSTAKGKERSDAFIKKLQEAKAKLEEMIKMEKEPPATPPSKEEEVGEGVINNLEQAKDFTSNSQTRKELDKIIAKIKAALEFAKAGEMEQPYKEDKAMAKKQDALEEIDVLLSTAKGKGESDSFIKKLQEAKEMIQKLIEMELIETEMKQMELTGAPPAPEEEGVVEVKKTLWNWIISSLFGPSAVEEEEVGEEAKEFSISITSVSPDPAYQEDIIRVRDTSSLTPYSVDHYIIDPQEKSHKIGSGSIGSWNIIIAGYPFIFSTPGIYQVKDVAHKSGYPDAMDTQSFSYLGPTMHPKSHDEFGVILD